MSKEGMGAREHINEFLDESDTEFASKADKQRDHAEELDKRADAERMDTMEEDAYKRSPDAK